MRTFSFVEGPSDKFWHIDVNGASITVNYGRAGTKGQTKTTEYSSSDKAETEAAKLIASKVKKGYTEGVTGGQSIPAAPATKPTPPALASKQPQDEPAQLPGDHLEIRTTRYEKAMLAQQPIEPRPLSDAELEVASTPSIRKKWLLAHAENVATYRFHVVYDTPPFEGVPTAEIATWWLNFGHRWGGGKRTYYCSTLRERISAADKETCKLDLRLSAEAYNLPPEVLVASLLALAGPHRTLRDLTTLKGRFNWDSCEIIPALRALVVPLLTANERSFPPAPKSGRWGQPLNAADKASYELARAALFGTADDAREALAAACAFEYIDAWAAVPAVALLPEEERWAWLERVGFHNEPALMRMWLALSGPRGLPSVVAAIRNPDVAKPHANMLVKLLDAMLHGPGAVPVMLQLAMDQRVGALAVQWLTRHPRELAASTAQMPAAQHDTLMMIVRAMRLEDPDVFCCDVANPHVAEILTTLAQEDAAPVMDASNAPEWFTEAAAAEAAQPIDDGAIKPPKSVPSWADAKGMPPFIVDGIRLDTALTQAVLASASAGANSPTLAPRPLVAAVRDRMLAKDRDTVAVSLLDAFLTNGGKPADRCWFVAAGYLGSDQFVLKLTALVRVWPGESQHPRAVLGLDVLAATGTAGALQAISGIANKSKFKGVQTAARASLTKLAALQGLTVDQLEDRVVPDADLDAHGVKVFTYGQRSFRVSLSPLGKAVIRDLDAEGRPTGKPRASLPTPNSKDDPALAAEAKTDFATLRKQLTEIAKIQTSRLDQAMVTGRTWSAEEHSTLIAQHPVLNSLVRPLVWQVSVDSAPVGLVRVNEDHEYVTVEEDVYAVPADAQLRLAHPLLMSETDRDAWRSHLIDYDLVAPLEQLDRPTFGLPAGQQGKEMGELPSGSLNPGALVSTLERLGWRRGEPLDAGVVCDLWLPFESHGVAAVLFIADGLWSGMLYESGDQRLENLYLAPLEENRPTWWYHGKLNPWLAWETADPVIVSEVRRSMAALEAKMT